MHLSTGNCEANFHFTLNLKSKRKETHPTGNDPEKKLFIKPIQYYYYSEFIFRFNEIFNLTEHKNKNRTRN